MRAFVVIALLSAASLAYAGPRPSSSKTDLGGSLGGSFDSVSGSSGVSGPLNGLHLGVAPSGFPSMPSLGSSRPMSFGGSAGSLSGVSGSLGTSLSGGSGAFGYSAVPAGPHSSGSFGLGPTGSVYGPSITKFYGSVPGYHGYGGHGGLYGSGPGGAGFSPVGRYGSGYDLYGPAFLPVHGISSGPIHVSGYGPGPSFGTGYSSGFGSGSTSASGFGSRFSSSLGDRASGFGLHGSSFNGGPSGPFGGQQGFGFGSGSSSSSLVGSASVQSVARRGRSSSSSSSASRS